MKKLIQWTLFIDMLGYGDINGHIKEEESAEDFYKFMKSNSDIFAFQDRQEMRDIYENSDTFNLYDYYDIKVNFISDSIIISYNPIEQKDEIPEGYYYFHSANTLIIIIKRLQTLIYKCLKEKNIFLRGGISNKYCFIKDNFAFGEGLIEAYKTESQIAKYPRICLSNSVIENSKLIKCFEYLCEKIYFYDSFIAEENNVFFLDYLAHNIYDIPQTEEGGMATLAFFKIHKDSIINKLNEINFKISNSHTVEETNKLIKVKEKFEWIRDYHNTRLFDFFDNNFQIN
ncbi:hypothetical protein [Empedobacter falsenii]